MDAIRQPRPSPPPLRDPYDMLPPALLPTIGALALIFALTLYGFMRGNMFLFGAMIGFAPVVYLVNRPDVLVSWIVALFSSFLTIPYMPEKLNAFYAFSLLAVFVFTARKIINKEAEPWTSMHFFLVFFLVVLFLTACVRGFGLRMLGGSTWGGGQYIQMFIGIGLLMTAPDIVLTARQWRRAIYAMCLLSLLPVAAEAIFAFSGGRIYQQYYFIVVDLGIVNFLQDLQQGNDLARLQVANVASSYLFMLSLLVRRQRNNALLVLGLIAASTFLAGISGHRIAFVSNLLLLVVDSALRRDVGPVRRFINIQSVSFVALFLLSLPLAPWLPVPYQRALAWVPFLDISPEAQMDAYGTVTWRFDVWRRMLQEIPDYLWIGKGFAFSGDDLYMLTRSDSSSVDFVMTSRNYHNGMLSLLLDLGVFGFIAGVGFMMATLRIQLRNFSRPWKNPDLKRMHRVVLAALISQIVLYFFLAGGPLSFVTFFLYIIILMGLRKTDGIPPPASKERLAKRPPLQRRTALSPG